MATPLHRDRLGPYDLDPDNADVGVDARCHPRLMRRRALLRGLAFGGAALATGCIRSEVTPSPLPTASGTVTVPTTAPPTPTLAAPNWEALRAQLRDGLVRSGDPTYETGRVLYNTRFDGVRPLAIARCATVETSEMVRFARPPLPLALRSGGHTTAFGPPSRACNRRRRMSTFAVQDGSVTVGAGTRLLDVMKGSRRAARASPPELPHRGITGLTLGGVWASSRARGAHVR